ncbi:MAG: hypothetical protein WC325_11390 [Candidatus Bathyarchaeia archaeon]|jgi:predicted transcriptional regulator
MYLSKVLASSCRQRILKALSKNKALAMMQLLQAVNSTYNEVNRNVGILKSENLITEEYHGHKRILRLNYKNNKTLILLKTLRTLDQTNHRSHSDDDRELIAQS